MKDHRPPPVQHDDVVSITELERDECWRLLRTQVIGRVAFAQGRRPIVLPVNHVVDGETIVFRTAPDSALGSLVRHEPVVFEVDSIDMRANAGWSVLVTGEIERIDARGRHISPAPQPWAPGERDEWVRIVPSSITGRAISRRRPRPDGTFRPYTAPG